MYDVRGIQNYVFKTNAVKEIVGASKIIDGIIINGLKEFKEGTSDKSLYLLDWKNDSSTAFLDDTNIMMQVMFVGGGNAYVLYRNKEVCTKVNRFLAKYVLEKTYSLHLAVASVEKTDSYKEDYKKINEEMRRVKAKMPESIPTEAFPFVKTDSITGYPLSKIKNGKIYCTESKLKLDAFDSLPEDIRNQGEKIFDNMVTKKGDNSTLALVHTDGNGLGNTIMKIMENNNDYVTAIETMRGISKDIDDTFKSAYESMEKWMDKKSNLLLNNQYKKYRKIILAGDDICFICNPKLALGAIKCFITELNKMEPKSLRINNKVIRLSVCAGIAFFNSHFPFSDAYKIAEACCDSAKERAKSAKCSNNGVVGNFIDFQMCTNINASNLDVYRDKHYKLNGEMFINRPYYVYVKNDSGLNNKNKDYLFSNLTSRIDILTSSKTPRSIAKEIRAVIVQGDNEIKKELLYLQSRDLDQFNDLEEMKSVWYDACELMDFVLKERN